MSTLQVISRILPITEIEGIKIDTGVRSKTGRPESGARSADSQSAAKRQKKNNKPVNVPNGRTRPNLKALPQGVYRS